MVHFSFGEANGIGQSNYTRRARPRLRSDVGQIPPEKNSVTLEVVSMSRKARLLSELPEEENASPKIWVANRGYSGYKPDLKTGRTRDAVVVLYHKSYLNDIVRDEHPLLIVGGVLGKLLSRNGSLSTKNIVSVDISSLVPSANYADFMNEEGASINLCKKISKPVCRVLEKMFLLDATIVAFGTTCQLLMKIVSASSTVTDAGHRLKSENVNRLIFINPEIPASCVNSQFRGTPSAFATKCRADVYFTSESERDRRLPIIRTYFLNGGSFINRSMDFVSCLLLALSVPKTDSDLPTGTATATHRGTEVEDVDATNVLGETIWMAEVTLIMNRNSKQYEQFTTDLTNDMREQCLTNLKKRYAQPARSSSVKIGVVIKKAEDYDADNGKDRIGGLVLRGNRCVLVRSLGKLWKGMRIPSVCAAEGESPQETAARAVSEQCDIDADEFYPLAVPPITMYSADTNRGDTSIYLMYAVEPPPDGPLEDQDTEAVRDPYDWYTWRRAVNAFMSVGDESSVLAMRTIACALSAATSCVTRELVPRKWGGVFGQEWILSLNEIPVVTEGKSVVGVKPHRYLPIMIVVGAFGSGKTSLIQSILANQGSCQLIAVIVSTIIDINFDAALLQQGGEVDDKLVDCSTFKIIESNRCTSELDIIAEVRKVAQDEEFDYCIVEAAATVDLPRLKRMFTTAQNENDNNNSNSSGGKGGGCTFYLDNVVAVVDGATCLSAVIEKKNSVKSKNIQGGVIQSIMYRQIQAAEVIIINKLDVIQDISSETVASTSDTNVAIIKSALRQLNSFAPSMETKYGDIDPLLLLHSRRVQTRSSDPSDVIAASLTDTGVKTMIFRARNPFHPSRFDTAMRLLGKGNNDVSSSCSGCDNSEITRGTVLRINGYAWLANYPDNQGVFSFTYGHQYELKLGEPWWASIAKAKWPVGLDDAIRPLWIEPYGDRQIELHVIGTWSVSELLDIEKCLSLCVLTDEEFRLGQDAWNEMEDPFSFAWN